MTGGLEVGMTGGLEVGMTGGLEAGMTGDLEVGGFLGNILLCLLYIAVFLCFFLINYFLIVLVR